MAPRRLRTMIILAAAATLPPGCPSQAGHGWRPVARPHPHFRNRVIVPPPPGFPQIYVNPPPVPGELGPPRPSPGYSPQEPLYPAPPPVHSQGMVITIQKALHENPDGGDRPSPLIDRPKQAAEQLAACWSPPLPQAGDTVEVTIRFAFNGVGGVIGMPQITYVKAGSGMTADEVRRSILSAVKDCTPLRFTKSMAASAPGYPLAVRFIGRRAENAPATDQSRP
jgi:hypothetical protein